MAKATCSIEGCEKPVKAWGWCNNHYGRMKRLGLSPRKPDPDPVMRFWGKVNKRGLVPQHRTELGPCWIWQGQRNKNGYGICFNGKRQELAHRFSWHLERGPIPSGQHVCHRCDEPSCIRPDHLFLGTQSDNVADMTRKRRHWRHSQTHCWRGHEFTPENTIVERSGSRRCRICKNIAEAGRRERNRQKKATMSRA